MYPLGHEDTCEVLGHGRPLALNGHFVGEIIFFGPFAVAAGSTNSIPSDK